MLSLSDDELDVLFNAAWPLDVAMRDAFLRACALELGRYPRDALGPGLVARTASALQREFFHAVLKHSKPQRRA
jgi:hypothetical protein